MRLETLFSKEYIVGDTGSWVSEVLLIWVEKGVVIPSLRVLERSNHPPHSG